VKAVQGLEKLRRHIAFAALTGLLNSGPVSRFGAQSSDFMLLLTQRTPYTAGNGRYSTTSFRTLLLLRASSLQSLSSIPFRIRPLKSVRAGSPAFSYPFHLSQNPGLAIASNCGDLTTIASASHQKSGDITTPASDSEGPLQGII